MEVYNTKYVHLAFFAEQELIEMTWLPATEEMTEEEFKQENINYISIILKLSPKNMYSDTTNLLFAIRPELQEWSQTIIVSLIEKGLNKVAILISKDLIVQLGVEQAMEEKEASKLNTRYFDNKEEAKEWLLAV